MERISIKASAGTGKTYKISLEYIKMLFSNMNVEEILITTFTKKATLEIKERIFLILKEMVEEKRNIIDDLYINTDKIKEVYYNLLFNKNRMKIYTIDSFIISIFNKFVVAYFNFYGYELINNNEKYYEEILQNLIEDKKKFEKIKILFDLIFEKDVTNYIKLIKEFIYKRWYFLLIKDKNKDFSLKEIKFEEIEIILEDIINIIKILIQDKNEPIKNFLKNEFHIILDKKNRKTFIEKNFSILLEEYIWDGVKLKSNKKNEKSFNELKKLYDKFRKKLSYYVYIYKILPSEEELVKIANIIFNEYNILKERDKSFNYEDILIYTYKFIYEIDKNIVQQDIKVIFIDEFQDTNILQWLILKPFVEKSLKFIAVGDEKQAIYGWRGSEKELFKKLSNNLNTKEENLDISYRSEKEIIDFTNKFFNNLNLLNHDVKFLPFNDKGYIEIKAIKKDKFVSEIIKLVNNKKINLKKTCILCRTNKDLDEIALQLNIMDIPYTKENSSIFIENKAIKPLYWILKFLLDNDFYFLVKFLRNEIINISSKELKEIFKQKVNIESFFEENFFSLNLSENLLKIFNLLKILKMTSFDSLIEKCLKYFSFKETFSSLNYIKNLKVFLEKSKKFYNLNDFINFLEDNQQNEDLKQSNFTESDSIKLMTIHKSKGLEFETVILYWNLSNKLNRKNYNLSLNVSFSENFNEIKDYCFTIPYLEKSLEFLDLDYIKKNFEKFWEEEKNNLYVGLTRAKKNLFFLISFDRSIESIEKLSKKTLKNYGDEIFYEIKLALINSINLEKIQDIYEKPYIKGSIYESYSEIEEDFKKIDLNFLKKYFQF